MPKWVSQSFKDEMYTRWYRYDNVYIKFNKKRYEISKSRKKVEIFEARPSTYKYLTQQRLTLSMKYYIMDKSSFQVQIWKELFIMQKLFIEYREEDKENDYYKGNTYFTFTIDNKVTEISIAPNETRLLKEIVYGIEKQLQDGYHLEKNEKFEISELDKEIIRQEENMKCRVNSRVYNLCKMAYEKILQEKTTLDDIIRILRKEGVA